MAKKVDEITLFYGRNTEKIIFINARNEWAEGNYLELCQEWGRAYLESTYRALSSVP